MPPALNKRRSVNGRSSPRGYPAGGLRKPSSFRSRRPGILADKKQVNVLRRGLNVLNKDGGSGSGLGTSGSRFDLTSAKKVPMKVAVRVRPLNARENTSNSIEILTVSGPKMLVFDPERENEDFFFKNQKIKDVTAKKHKNISFAFDNVYDETSTNFRIYEDIMKPALDTLLTGFNFSVFAYGPTGSGKTFTMLGSDGNPGLTYLTINDLFSRLDGMKEDFRTGVKMSYFEVYNEQVHDLINYTAEPLQIMEVGRGRSTIKNLSEHYPENVDELINMLTTGNKNRSQHPTDHNAESSRSHAILQVTISMNEKHSSSEASKKVAKLVMVDLAGSEKGCATGFSGARFQEGSSINKSLLALGKIMETLASGKKAYTYRDSKLTRILKDSLGGNSRTVMIANVSPAEAMYEDTLNTLRYAQKAKKISCDASKNVITVKHCMTEYTRVVDELATKIQKLEKEKKKKDEEIEDLEAQDVWRKMKLDEANQKILALESQIKEQEDWKHKYEMLEIDVQHERLTQESDKIYNDYVAELRDRRDGPFEQAIFEEQDGGQILKRFEPHCEWSKEVNGILRPKLEKLYLEFQTKLQQVKNFKSLFTSTGDARYEKSVGRTCKKIANIIRELRSVYEALFSKAMPEEVYAPLGSTCTFQFDDLEKMNQFKCAYHTATGETKVLHTQVANLTRDVLRKDSALVDFARLANTMCNILKHYNHLTPALEEEYEKAIASFCSPPLQFVGNIECEPKMHTFFAPETDASESQNSDHEAFIAKVEDVGVEITFYKKTVEDRLKSIGGLVAEISELDGVNTTFESVVPPQNLAEEVMEVDAGNLSSISDLPSSSQGAPSITPEGGITFIDPATMQLFGEGYFSSCIPAFSTDEDLSRFDVEHNSGGSTLITNETMVLAGDNTFTIPLDLEDEENEEPFMTYSESLSEINAEINSIIAEARGDTTPSSSSIDAPFPGRSPSLLIPPKQYKSSEAGPSFKCALTGQMKPPPSKQLPSDQRRTEQSGFKFAGQLPGHGAPLKLASTHNYKSHSTSISPPGTKGYQLGIGAKPKFGSSSSGGKMSSSKIAPQRKSPYAKSKKAAVNTLRKSSSTSSLQKIRPTVNTLQSKSKPHQQDKGKWQPPK